MTSPTSIAARAPRARGLGRTASALLTLGAAGAWLAFAPEPRTPQPRPAFERLFEAVAPGAGVALAAAPDGDVWWVTRRAVVRFADGGGAHAAPLAFAPDAVWTAAHVDAAGRVWLGTHGGELHVRDADGRWLASFPSVAERTPVRAIATFGAEAYVAAGTLWRGALDGDGLHAVARFAGREVTQVATDPAHGVAVATAREVWHRTDSGWRRMWRARHAGQAVSALAFAGSGELWVGTADGLLRLGEDARERWELVGTRVDALSENRSGAVFAATRAGLFARHAGAWRSVGAAGSLELGRVDGVAAGDGGALWLALGRRGLFRAGGRGALSPSS